MSMVAALLATVGASGMPGPSSASSPGSAPGYVFDTGTGTSAGTKVLVYEVSGGWFADCEKRPGDDGVGNPAPEYPGEEDDLMCWAAASSNMLTYSGWGYVGDPSVQTVDQYTEDWIFQYFQDHIYDDGGWETNGNRWWFTGSMEASTEDVEGAGFWPQYDPADYVAISSARNSVQQVADWTDQGWVTGLDIINSNGGAHAITCWGYNYDPSFSRTDAPEKHFLGLWVSDSDSDKGSYDPPNRLSYKTIEWDPSRGVWKFTTGYVGWLITSASVLKTFPENRPTADAGPGYTGLEGYPMEFDASLSTDLDGDRLMYRWDFDADGEWDTDFSYDPKVTTVCQDDYDGEVFVQVFDGHLLDVASARFKVLNFVPAIWELSSVVTDEGKLTELKGRIMDMGAHDTFHLRVQWGDGTTSTRDFPAGTTYFTITHTYEDGGTIASQATVYSVEVTVSDDDSASGHESTTVTVRNVAPAFKTITPPAFVKEGAEAKFMGSFLDPSHNDTFVLDVDWGDGRTSTFKSTEGGFYPIFVGQSFTIAHTYLDDDPSGTPKDEYQVHFTLWDDDGTADTKLLLINVTNVMPSLTYVTVDGCNERGTAYINATIVDGSYSDSIHIVVDWGDGRTESYDLAHPGMISYSHRYYDDPTGATDHHSVKFLLSDDDCSTPVVYTVPVEVHNLAPVILALEGAEAFEGQAAKVHLEFGDTRWDDFNVTVTWGDGATETVPVPDGDLQIDLYHQYLDDDPSRTPVDVYAVQVRVVDDDGGEATASTSVTVANVAPTAIMVPSNERTIIALDITIDDPGRDTFEVHVDWGDGRGSTFSELRDRSLQLRHEYPGYETFELRLIVVDDDGGEFETRASYTMLPPNDPPEAYFTLSPDTIATGGWIYVDASGSNDRQDPASALVVRWDWEDDGAWDTVCSTDKQASHQFFGALGAHTVRLEVMDTGGSTSTTTRSFTLANTDPTAHFSIDAETGAWSHSFQVDASACFDMDQPASSLSVLWDWEGDGGFDTSPSTVKTATHTFGSAGQFLIVLQVQDSNGGVSTFSRQVVVTNAAPVAALLPAPGQGTYGTPFHFDASASSDADHPSSALQFRWTADGVLAAEWGTASEWDGKFAIDGEHIVTVEVRDPLGMSSSAQAQVLVDGTAPNTEATVDGTGANGWFRSDVSITLSAQDPGEDAVAGCAISYAIGGGAFVPYEGPILLIAEGEAMVSFFAVDGLGNAEAPKTITVRIDKSAPATLLSIDGAPCADGGSSRALTSAVIALAPMDAVSGVGLCEYSLDGSTGAWAPYPGPFSLPAGSYSLCYRSTDLAGNLEIAGHHSLEVVPPIHPTSLAYVGQTSGHYSDRATLSAVLTCQGAPLEGLTVAFALGSQSCSAVTDATGAATAWLTLDQQAASATLSVSFAGGPGLAPCSIGIGFDMAAEGAGIAYTGETIIPTTDSWVDLRATVFQEQDGSLGDLTRARVAFLVYDAAMANLLVSIGPVQVSATGEPGTGVATARAAVGAGSYVVRAAVAPQGYFAETSSAPAALTVVTPTGVFVTGAGMVQEQGGGYGAFGFVVMYNKLGKLHGSFSYTYEQEGLLYFVQSTAITGLAFESDHAFFEGWAQVRSYDPATGVMTLVGDGFRFRVDCWDNSAYRLPDTFRMVLLDPNGALEHMVGPSVGAQVIGQVQIHRPRK